MGSLWLPPGTEEAWCALAVLPPFRRHGLASRLLQSIMDLATAERRTQLLTLPHRTAPETIAFLTHLGATPSGAVLAGTTSAAERVAKHIWQAEVAKARARLDQRGMPL